VFSTVRLGRIDYPQIERLLFSATTGAIFFARVALSPPVSEPLNATSRMKITPVVAENKRRSIFAWSFWRDKLNINLLAFTCKSVQTPQTFDLHISVNIQPQDKLQSANHPHFCRSTRCNHYLAQIFQSPLTQIQPRATVQYLLNGPNSLNVRHTIRKSSMRAFQ